jgi:hypothetical protein
MLLAGPGLAQAGDLTAAQRQDLQRAVAMVGASASESAAVRQESAAHGPSPAFMLGAALAAWINAAAILRYDLATPSGDGDDSEAIAIDCYDERVAFDHLDERVRSATISPEYVFDVANISSGDALHAWIARRAAGQPPRCR